MDFKDGNFKSIKANFLLYIRKQLLTEKRQLYCHKDNMYNFVQSVNIVGRVPWAHFEPF